ncbi:hypothetical protein PV328_000458 [Microctonus aethiopoides]|uniref:Golgi integral membrane protein 4 n=1 Tax=Microctonus aethiopoides TaxID=144406 RepID=A0AA39FVJ5_9HYME|nr:hypothetical protein PV328_000458 [Microctonus aethiopoides]
MNGTRLGRGRGGRLALYGGCLVVLVLLVFLYRAATTEMTRLHELNVQCTHQEEALAAQLQVIFEYKVRLEKSLSEEKTSNLALKHELQERATREKTLRDKDIVEATQRYNSLQQQHKILQSEHQDLRDECDKRQKQSLIETGRLEATLQDLRSQMRKARDDKDKSMEHLKNKYLEVKIEKEQLENKYNDLLKSNGNTDSTIEHLNKQVFQLKRELEDTKMNCKSTLSGMNMINPRLASQSIAQPSVEKSESPSLQQQKNASTSMSKVLPAVSATQSTINSASTSSYKSLNPAAASSVKLLPRVKLPMGVVPIPKMIDPKIDKDESKRPVSDGNNSPADNRNNQRENEARAPENEVHDGVDDVAGSDFAAGRRVGEQILRRQENPAWYKVKPGVQEIGDVLNQPGRIPEFGDTGLHQGGDDQYDNLDYYKEPQPKNNDIHLDEGEEDEGEDEDDQGDYQNNPQAEKHE